MKEFLNSSQLPKEEMRVYMITRQMVLVIMVAREEAIELLTEFYSSGMNE